MKRVFILLCLFLVIPNAFAFRCIRIGDPDDISSAIPNTADRPTTIDTPINSDIDHGENIFGNVADFIQCKNNDPKNYVDYMYLRGVKKGNVFVQNGLEAGVIANQQNVVADASGLNVLIFKLTDGQYHGLDIQMYFKVPDKITDPIVINKGDTLMTLDLYKYSTPNAVQGYFTWIFKAANKAVLNTNNCEITDPPLTVDFESIPVSKVGTDGSETITKEVTLNFDCQNPNINQEVKVTLSASTASFSSDAIKTDMNNLGVEMYHEGSRISPSKSFKTQMENGTTNTKLSFSLIKKQGSTLNTGAFSASGALVVSPP